MSGTWNIVLSILLALSCCWTTVNTKWVEGHLKTPQNWAFLSRFCFLSYEGQFEYQIEFNSELGVPNLLLYYDDHSQWPSVYHSNKTCAQKEAVLNKAGQNQIIPLSHWYPENDFSGCVLKHADPNIQNMNNTNPTKAKNKTTSLKPKPRVDPNVPSNPNHTTQDPSYFDQFLITSSPEDMDMATTEEMDLTGDTVTKSTLDNQTESDVEFIEGYEHNPNVYTTQGSVNESDISNNINDVENLFDPNSQSEGARIRKKRHTWEKIRSSKFNPLPPRPQPPYAVKGGSSKGRLIISCHNSRRFRSVRERWWFIAISNCGSSKGLDIKYRFLMTNGPPGDYWHEHFSADEFYVLPILIAFSFAYVLMMIALVMCSVELKMRQMLHSTYKLFLFSVTLQQIGVLIQSLAYVKYAVNGFGAPATKVMGQLFCGASEISYLLLLVLMAKGYTITRARLKITFTVKLTVFICCYFITYMSLFIYQAQVFDPGEVLYLYESPAGYGLIVLRVGAWFIFIYAIIFTIKKYPEKSIFYYPFSVCGTMWFFAGPLFILTANYYIDKWVRESVVTATLLFITFSGHISFLLLTLPVFANKNFPYHVRTTQIGAMELANNADDFSHHVYHPADQNHLPLPVIIPLTKRTEELMNGSGEHSNNGTIHSNGTAISFISGNQQDNNQQLGIGQHKLSVSTQHSTESVNSITDKKLDRSDSLKNRFVPPKEDVTSKAEDDDSIFVIGVKEDVRQYSYKDDPDYLKDINNPFLVSASFRARRGLLEPLVRKNAYIPPPPSWTLAKNKNKTTKENKNIPKKTQDYNLQGVIGTFPPPNLNKTPDKNNKFKEEKKDAEKEIEVEIEIEKNNEDEENSESREESLQLFQVQNNNKLDETLNALYKEENGR